MNRILTIDQVKALRHISNVVGFIKALYEELVDVGKHQLNLRKWSKCVCKYYMDVVTINTKKELTEGDLQDLDSLRQVLIFQTAEKMNVEEKRVVEAYNKVLDLTHPLLSIDTVLSKIPSKIMDNLLIKATDEEIISLILRYYILLLNEGLFLSVDLELYESLQLSSTLPVVKCYASPFDNSFSYCSLFEEDETFGAYPRFEEYVERLNIPCRLLVNPPYTVRSITTCIEKLISYMTRCGGEFILMLPVMINFEPIDRILEYPGTRGTILLKDRYTLYTAIGDSEIIAPMNLWMIVNVRGGCFDAASRMLSDMTYHLRCKADRLIKKI